MWIRVTAHQGAPGDGAAFCVALSGLGWSGDRFTQGGSTLRLISNRRLQIANGNAPAPRREFALGCFPSPRWGWVGSIGSGQGEKSRSPLSRPPRASRVFALRQTRSTTFCRGMKTSAAINCWGSSSITSRAGGSRFTRLGQIPRGVGAALRVAGARAARVLMPSNRRPLYAAGKWRRMNSSGVAACGR